MDKAILANNFSKSAFVYDRYADIQKQTARELLACLGKRSFRKILDIGCGTGDYTGLLRDTFKDAGIVALDISADMIGVAKTKLKCDRIRFVVSDAEEIYLVERFDLITSNACFHWFGELENSINRFKSLLDEEGVILFSIFGRQTLSELNVALKAVFKDATIAVNGFISREPLKNILKKIFRNVDIREVNYEKVFDRLNDLLYAIKYTGTRGKGLQGKAVFVPDDIRKIEKAYLNRFGHIKARYQVFFCECTP